MGVCLLFFTYMRYPLSQTWKVWIILTSFEPLACKGNPYLWDKASLFHIFVSFELIKISVAYICEVYCYFVVSCCKTYNPSYGLRKLIQNLFDTVFFNIRIRSLQSSILIKQIEAIVHTVFNLVTLYCVWARFTETNLY